MTLSSKVTNNKVLRWFLEDLAEFPISFSNTTKICTCFIQCFLNLIAGNDLIVEDILVLILSERSTLTFTCTL